MEKRIHIIVALSIAIIAFILGSFFDLNISKALYIKNYSFGHFVAALGLLVSYGFIALYSGVLFNSSLRLKKSFKIILSILSFIILIGTIYFSWDIIFDANGFNKEGIKYKILGMSATAIFSILIFYFGYKFSKDNPNDKTWLFSLIILIMILLCLLIGSVIIKDIFHRPRFRTVYLNIEGVEFHNWWEPFKEYKNYITDSITKEEFKSFPSGHATISMASIIGFIYLFIINPNMKKYQTFLFYIGYFYSLFISLTRILSGAHFLSDVAFGSIISLTILLIGNEIILKNKLVEEFIWKK